MLNYLLIKNGNSLERTCYYNEHLPCINIRQGILDLLKRKQYILDIGAGTGSFAQQVGTDKVVCLEQDKTAIKTLRSLGLNTWHKSIEKPIIFKHKKFDAITAFDVLEHLVGAEQMMRNCRHLLVDGGLLIVRAGTADGEPTWFWDDYTHVRPYTQYSLQLLFQDFGFKTQSIAPHYVEFEGKSILDSWEIIGTKQ